MAEAIMQGELFEVQGYSGLVDSDELGDIVYKVVYQICLKPLLFAELDDCEECSASFPEPHEYRYVQWKVTLKNGQLKLGMGLLFNHSKLDCSKSYPAIILAVDSLTLETSYPLG